MNNIEIIISKYVYVSKEHSAYYKYMINLSVVLK